MNMGNDPVGDFNYNRDNVSIEITLPSPEQEDYSREFSRYNEDNAYIKAEKKEIREINRFFLNGGQRYSDRFK